MIPGISISCCNIHLLMLARKELEKWLLDTASIVHIIQTSLRNLKRINNPEDEEEKQILQDPCFQNFRYQLEFITVEQLCKLFVNSDIERRNFGKLFNRYLSINLIN